MQYTQTELINAALSAPDTAPMTLEQIVSQEIEDFRKSPQYAEILTAEEYYKNRSDIQKKQVDIEGRSTAALSTLFTAAWWIRRSDISCPARGRCRLRTSNTAMH